MKISALVVAFILAIWGSGYLWSKAASWVSMPSDLGVVGGYITYALIIIFWGNVVIRTIQRIVKANEARENN